MPVANVVSHKFPLEQINEAFEFAEWHGREGGTVASRVALTM
jgi:Zn-dependent alcohol dehydrogenase